MTRALCHHCGLPIGSPRRSAPDGRAFCCYGCYLARQIVGEQGEAGPAASILARLGVAGVLAMNVMMISLLLYSDALAGIGSQAIHAFRWALLGLSAPVLAILGVPFLLGATRELKQALPSIDSLIAVGALAGFGVSAAHVIQGRGPVYFDTATMLLVLVTLGKLLEASAKVEASKNVKALLQLAPPVARLLSAEGEKEVPASELRVGDRVRVKPGERVPADGLICAGASSVQEAALTGEFQPRACGPRDRVFGGSANGEGELTVEVTAAGDDALLAQIGRLVEQAQAQRAPVERLASRAATVFVPVVFVVAAGALGYWLWRGDAARGGMSALAVLVVACPCALGLATPLAICVALACAAREAVLVRSGEALETLAKVSRVFFDKTGTLTRGEPTLRAIACCAGASCAENEALAWLGSLESGSEHVMARAVVAAAKARGLALGRVEGFRAFPGRGAAGRVELDGRSREILAGGLDWLAAEGMDGACVRELPAADPGETLLFVAWEGRVRARAAIADAPRPEAAETISALRQAGIGVTMLSGDRRSAAEHLAQAIGAPEVKAECTPEAKLEEVRGQRRSGQVIAVVGDGINDAPALAEANVGIAMGGGTDLAREVGDITLLGDGLLRIPWLVHLARRTYRVIRQNLAWAFGYNLVAMALAFFGLLHPLVAALAMLGSSFFVLHNSLRLSRQRAPRAETTSLAALPQAATE